MKEAVAELAEAVDLLGVDLVAHGQRIDRQNELLAVQNERLSKFVPRSRLRWSLAVMSVAIAIVIAFGVVDRADVRRREHEAKVAEVADRDQRYAGCLRGNDLRATLRGVIERAYTPGPIPENLSPELINLFTQAQARAAEQRAVQLADPGIQPVDCDAAFPPIAN